MFGSEKDNGINHFVDEADVFDEPSRLSIIAGRFWTGVRSALIIFVGAAAVVALALYYTNE